MQRLLYLLILFSMSAVAQNYDVDISLGNWTFDGTMTYANNALTNVDVGMEYGTYQYASNFTAGSATGTQVTLVNYEGVNLPGFQWPLSFTLSAPLGAETMTVSNVSLVIDPNGAGMYQCGAPPEFYQPGPNVVGCGGTITDPPTQAPELSIGRAAEAITLLLGIFVVWRIFHPVDLRRE